MSTSCDLDGWPAPDAASASAGRCDGCPSMVMMGLRPSFLRFLMLTPEPLELGGAGASLWVLAASTSLPLIAADGVVAAKAKGKHKQKLVRRRGKMDEMDEMGGRGQGLAWTEGEAELGIDRIAVWQERCAWLLLRAGLSCLMQVIVIAGA